LRLVLDWDGTCTVRDSLVAAIHALGDPSVYEGSFQQRFGSYGEALAAEIHTLQVTEAEAAEWAVENVEIRAGFHEFVERYEPIVVSSGLPQLIRPVLEREGLAQLELRSNNAEVRADGWRVIFRDEGVCPVCGDKCKRRSLPDTRPLVWGIVFRGRCG